MGAPISYFDANDALNRVFFDGRFAGQPVYLTLDGYMSEQVGAALGIEGPGDVGAAICQSVGRYLSDRGDPYSRVMLDLKSWRRGGMETAPPCTATLFALAHAAAIMEGDEYTGKNNYYTRLAQLTRLDRSTLSLHGKSTEVLWEALNEWLLKNNYELGRPTAKALNAWIYVGFALSQAIVRAGDREQFHQFFERFGFSGNEPISSKEMGLYISHWMGSSRPSARLKKAWKDRELQERIIEAALAELSAWSSGRRSSLSSGSVGVSSSRLSLLANIVDGLMGRKLELRLGRSGDGIQEGPFLLEGSPQAFHLANDDFGTFATLIPSPLGAGGLGQKFSFQCGNQILDWQPRLIVPFALSPAGQWIEVTRASFGARHIVLVRDANDLPRKVELFLADAAIMPPTKETPSDMRGLPPGWVLYSNVQVRQPTSAPPQDLECLVPLGTEGSLGITAGLQLLQGFYHSQVGLEARFVAPQGPTHIEAFVPGTDSTAIHERSSSNEAECVLTVAPQAAGATPFIHFKAWHGHARPEIVEVFLRDANVPTPLPRDGRGRLVFKSLMSATTVTEPGWVAVEGFSVSGDLPALQDARETTGTKPPLGESEARQEASFSQALATHVGRQTCVERGYHYWKCESLPPGRPRTTPLEQRCTGCELALIVRDRGKKKAVVLPSFVGKLQSPQARSVTKSKLDHDLLLDAVSFLGSGSWGKLQSLIGYSADDDVMPRWVAQNLFLLGFIDVELRKGSNTIKSWCVPPPSLNFHAAQEAFLSGFRSGRLVGDIDIAIKQAGGFLTCLTCADRPAKIVISGLDAMTARQALAAVRDPHGRPVATNEDVASNLVRACATLAPIDDVLAPVSIGQPENLEWFDARKARWEKTKIALKAGAYRWNEGLQYYAIRDEAGNCRSGPYQAIKLLAARSEGVHLHGYDAGAKSFLASLGSDIPGLLGRALIACSGDLPIMGQGLVSYANVTPAIAYNLLDILYPESAYFHEEIKSYQRV